MNCWFGFHRLNVINILKVLHFEICFFHEICLISCMKSARFHHEIRTEHESARFHEIHWISWNLPDFIMKSAPSMKFTPSTWNQADFIHEIRQMSQRPMVLFLCVGLKELKDETGQITLFAKNHWQQQFSPKYCRFTEVGSVVSTCSKLMEKHSYCWHRQT